MQHRTDHSFEQMWGTIFLLVPVALAFISAFLFGDHEGFMRDQARRIAAAKEQEALQGPVLPASYEYEL